MQDSGGDNEGLIAAASRVGASTGVELWVADDFILQYDLESITKSAIEWKQASHFKLYDNAENELIDATFGSSPILKEVGGNAWEVEGLATTGDQVVNYTSMDTYVQTEISGFIEDAPALTQYARTAGAWVETVEEAPSVGLIFGRRDGAWVALDTTELDVSGLAVANSIFISGSATPLVGATLSATGTAFNVNNAEIYNLSGISAGEATGYQASFDLGTLTGVGVSGPWQVVGTATNGDEIVNFSAMTNHIAGLPLADVNKYNVFASSNKFSGSMTLPNDAVMASGGYGTVLRSADSTHYLTLGNTGLDLTSSAGSTSAVLNLTGQVGNLTGTGDFSWQYTGAATGAIPNEVVNFTSMEDYVASIAFTNVMVTNTTSISSVVFDDNFIPVTSNAFDIGSSNFPIRSLYVATNTDLLCRRRRSNFSFYGSKWLTG